MLLGMAVQNGEKNNEFFAEGLANHLFEKIVGDRGSLIWERIVKHYHFLTKYRQSLFSSLNSANTYVFDSSGKRSSILPLKQTVL